jgi:hypothetical protein
MSSLRKTTMTRRGAVLTLSLLLVVACAPTASQRTVDGPIPASEVRYRRQIFENERLAAFLLELPPQHATLMHRHDRDILSVFVNGGRTIGTFEGRGSIEDTFQSGDVRFRPAGFTHATRNIGADVFRSVIIEFAESHGVARAAPGDTVVSCTPADGRNCVREKAILCAGAVCAYEVTMQPGTMRSLPLNNDYLFIPLSEYSMRHETETTSVIRERSPGEVDYLRGGVASRSTNASRRPMRFILVSIENR